MFEGPLQDLIDELSRLPGVGPKSAQRIAFHLLHVEPADIARLQDALGAVRDGVTFCRICCNISRESVCRICADSGRDRGTICVVEEPKDIQVIERTGEYNGRYHVLGGALDPLANIGPRELNISTLLQRIGGVLPDRELADSTPDAPLYDSSPTVTEVILATDPNTEGEATASYLARLLRDFPDLVVSRLASGMPLGGDLEFVDELTLSRALSGRLTI
ncbi:recombination protein RecR [Corynebacterium pseudotuberculosis]|uniref:Recombination protein RecR n=2 Tax=Corynebacterium pseudotuberculosis TaxID=1719 RepID=D9QDS3_CORP2|nr:recombination mediator RecR [Corynebacterium pseudotuberculosis]AER68263.1 Recombination protein recR [Corynebacterium pseudotuberculosis 1/06-A]ADK27940.1 recombination protein RecR [Corynebacterium pseudotuberculosis FRC41]ADL09646.1 recombination protein RecR [Corynebacterium pseudotuberculosis C231]ADL20052.1 recombination protein RecR [Corynebacterium pseudotuberculosis 1002]ADO25443.1 recombination protein RecR [Corynebacterium pseudotuberculosis I19]